MIYSKITGRLGNQLFQYAALRALQIENCPDDKVLMLDFSNVYKSGEILNGFENSLQYFSINNVEEIKENQIPFLKRFEYILYRFISKTIKVISNKNISTIKCQKLIDDKANVVLNKLGLFFYSYGYYKPNLKKKNLFCVGHFESAHYFNSIRDILLKEFTPRFDVLESNKKMYSIINSTNSVCVTIRRGDYVSNEKWKKKFNICTKKYYEKAICEISKEVENPVFFFFSDEIDWVKENIDIPENSYFESGKDPVWEKLRLMYSCKHFIISNSTFSWWAQYLSKNTDKIVYAPSRWNNTNYNIDERPIDIYEEGWKILNVEN